MGWPRVPGAPCPHESTPRLPGAPASPAPKPHPPPAATRWSGAHKGNGKDVSHPDARRPRLPAHKETFVPSSEDYRHPLQGSRHFGTLSNAGETGGGSDFCVPPLRKACTLRTLCPGSEKLVFLSPSPIFYFFMEPLLFCRNLVSPCSSCAIPNRNQEMLGVRMVVDGGLDGISHLYRWNC